MKNYKELNPSDYELGSRIKIVEISDGHLGILKKRKSRIIMKDGQQIIDIADSIRSSSPTTNISLIISGPICSKTLKALDINSINIINEE